MSDFSKSKRVLHVINGLGLGGAETMLYNVNKYRDMASVENSTVVSLGESDHFAPSLRELGVQVVELNLRKSPSLAIKKFFELASTSDIVCSWSYHANVISLWTKLVFRHRLVWIINHEDTARETNKLTTWIMMKVCARFSRFANGIAYNGAASMMSHEKMGFRTSEACVVPNGCDTGIYSPRSKSEALLSDLLGKESQEISVVLSAGRWHPIKDHATLLRAYSQVVRSSANRVVALLCGPGVDQDNPDLVELIEKFQLQIGKDVLLLGPRDDLPQLMASCTVFVLHSKSEAFPNVLVQAMSSGARVVSTDVGIVEQLTKGAVAPIEPGDADGLAQEILNQLQSSEEQLDLNGRNLRQIIVEEYSIDKVVPMYERAIFGK